MLCRSENGSVPTASHEVVALPRGAAARAKMEREYDVRERIAELEDRYDQAIALFCAS
jgi:hypothetical protein